MEVPYYEIYKSLLKKFNIAFTEGIAGFGFAGETLFHFEYI